MRLGTIENYTAMERVVPDQLPYKFILNTPSLPAALPKGQQMSATLLARITSVTQRIYAHCKYRPMETNHVEQEALYLSAKRANTLRFGCELLTNYFHTTSSTWTAVSC